MNKSLWALILCAAVSNAADSPITRCAVTGTDIACTAQGAVRGMIENNMLTFKGLPYAQPPVGNLRWHPPVAPAAWEGVRDGSRFGAICPQIVAKKVTGDEDCLTVNVWRPRDLPAQALPVMVYLTGGGNHGLSGIGTAGFGGVNYNGGAFVPEGVVFVSFNIRLGVLGFLALPALDAERPEHISGNYGNLDQIAMLKWLQQNIAGFGGDPKRIMVFGTKGWAEARDETMLTTALVGQQPKAEVFPAVDSLGVILEAFGETIETGKPFIVTTAEMLDVAGAFEAIIASMEQGKPVKVSRGE